MFPDDVTLHINYIPELEFRVSTDVPGAAQDSCGVHVRLRHSGGHFEYVDNLCFTPEDFVRFAQGLSRLRQGIATCAALNDVGGMLVFELNRTGRRLDLSLNIREYLPCGGSGSLSANIPDVDYDLFVNKLLVETERFLEEFRSISPSKVEGLHNEGR